MKLENYKNENEMEKLKFKEYSMKSIEIKPLAQPVIYVHNSGIRINDLAVEYLKLPENPKISFLQNEDEPETWAIRICEHGFPFHRSGKGLLFLDSNLSYKIRKSVGKENAAHMQCRFEIGIKIHTQSMDLFFLHLDKNTRG